MKHENHVGTTPDNVYLYEHPQSPQVLVECICAVCNQKRRSGTLPEYIPDVERYAILALGHMGATGTLRDPLVFLYPHPSGEPGAFVECLCDQCSAARKAAARRPMIW